MAKTQVVDGWLKEFFTSFLAAACLYGWQLCNSPSAGIEIGIEKQAHVVPAGD